MTSPCPCDKWADLANSIDLRKVIPLIDVLKSVPGPVVVNSVMADAMCGGISTESPVVIRETLIAIFVPKIAMEGLIIYSILPTADDLKIIACLNLYGNLISYRRLDDAAHIVYEDASTLPPLVWCDDNRLHIKRAPTLTEFLLAPSLVPKNISDAVLSQSHQLEYAVEYFITRFPRDTTLVKLKEQIRLRYGPFILLQRKKGFAFVLFDRQIREQKFRDTYRLEMTKICREQKRFEACINCDSFNRKNFRACRICNEKRDFCVFCTRENLPRFKFCNFCGEKKMEIF